ncbi:MAG: alpha/beta hydrolase [Planctomycetota bacterium]|nr:alpha/beta hydrolase [Planctomycetota bacterium]
MREVSFISGIHRIDARWYEPSGPARGTLVVAHPHPAHGGNMDHPVVTATCERATAHGLAALRFDFRGVGLSEGDRTDFEGHLDDWRMALADATRRSGSGPIYGAGFSYGSRSLAWLLHRAPGPRPELAGLLLLAPATRVPTSRRDFGNLLLGRTLSEAALDGHVLENLRSITLPCEVLVGANDVVAPPAELAANLPAHANLQVLPDLNHFFSRSTGAGALAREPFTAAVDTALARLVPTG